MITKRTAIAAFGAALALAGCGSELGTDTYEVSLSCGEDCNHAPSQSGTGSATVDGQTGQVDITVQGLPMLTGEVYEGWLAGGDETPISTGRFNTDAQGAGSSTITLGDISSTTYERVVLTVEPEPDPDPAPDPRHSIGGDIE
ncbi:MAG: anti-sigma factor [Deltaproteobacteria bacterium]|jgi:hypothetical protein|nr:anti-sigma factor [Deltaproteobacteria bacterium]MBW2537081.1 anti-sigma factor [Deltaproteobacteria bacterium]